MSGKTLQLELDGDNCISVTLSDSGRISLSDITAATIGNLEDDCWTDNRVCDIVATTSEETVPAVTNSPQNVSRWEAQNANQSSVCTQAVSVLRPWESLPAVTSTDQLHATGGTYSHLPDFKPPPSYQEHIKRHYEECESDQENHKSKRIKTDQRQQLSNLSKQISSFYEKASSRPLSAVTNQFSYSELNNFMKQERSENIHTPVKPASRVTPIHQPWASPGKNLDFSFNLSNILSQPAEQSKCINVNSNFCYSDASPVYLPATPAGKVAKPYFESPGMDSRLNDSLGLLGSPQMESPLAKHQYFSDLQALLSNECKREKVPQSLFNMQEKPSSPKKQTENVFTREQKLQERFEKLQPGHSEEVRQMSSFFRYQTALIETERFKTLHESKYPGSYKVSINAHFDDKLHQVMDRVEKSVQLMEKADLEVRALKVPKPRPHLRQEAIKVMEEWYSQNLDHPYPTPATVEYLAMMGNAGVEQVKKWFANKRNRNQNTRTLTEIAMKKRRLGQLSSN